MIDDEILAGFDNEVRGYIPTIRWGLDAFFAGNPLAPSFADACRHAHTIKGAAAMVGLPTLSHIGRYLDSAMKALRGGKLEPTPLAQRVLRYNVDAIEIYLNELKRGMLDEKQMLSDVARMYRQLRDATVKPTRRTTRPAAVEPRVRELPTPPQNGFAQPEPKIRPVLTAPLNLVATFRQEAEDHINAINNGLALLTQDPTRHDVMQEVRRSTHTLKGASAMVGRQDMTQVSHRMEDMLDRLSEGTQVLDKKIIDLLYQSVDVLDTLMDESVSTETVTRHSKSLFKRYERVLRPGQVQITPAPTPEPEPPAAELNEPEIVRIEAEELEEEPTEQSPSPVPTVGSDGTGSLADSMVRVSLQRLDELVKLTSEMMVTHVTLEQRIVDMLQATGELHASEQRLRRLSDKLEYEYESRTLSGNEGKGGGKEPAGKNGDFDALEFDRYTDFHLLTRQMSEAGTDVRTIEQELRMLLSDSRQIVKRQEILASDLQEKLLRTRMVPLSRLTSRMERVVRTVARRSAKSVEFVLSGDDIELDKGVLEQIVDPLQHLVRNAVDHGIETDEERQASGKMVPSTVGIRAYHDNNQVIIEVYDDGRGIDPEMIRRKAIERGFINATVANEMSARDLRDMLFLPGFSTASTITEVSGRGMGLDIVKENVTQAKGTVRLRSKPGIETVFTLQLPTTLAVTRVLLVSANQEQFAIPLTAIRTVEHVRADAFNFRDGQAGVIVAGEWHPLYRLGNLLQIPQLPDDAGPTTPILLLEADEREMAIAVDDVQKAREIVVKPLGNHLRQVPLLSGATIMGDGNVVLILNPNTLVNMQAPAGLEPVNIEPDALIEQPQQVMIVDDSVSVRRINAALVRKAGWDAVIAKDGLEALEMLEAGQAEPAVILLDIEMPRMDGYQLADALRQKRDYRDIPIIMITSRAGGKHRDRAAAVGVTSYLVKPYQEDQLLAMIGSLTSQPV